MTRDASTRDAGERTIDAIEALDVEDDALIAVLAMRPLVRSVPKRRYDPGRSPEWRIPAFIFLGLPAIAVLGAAIGMLLASS